MSEKPRIRKRPTVSRLCMLVLPEECTLNYVVAGVYGG
jgi:hypothetical protein